MGKVKFQTSLRDRLKVLRDMRDSERKRAEDMSDDIRESYIVASKLKFSIRTHMEKWMEANKDADASVLTNALLAVSSDIVQLGLTLASNDGERRGAIYGRYSTDFIQRAMETGLIVPPGRAAMKNNAPRPVVFGPDGNPIKVQ